MWYKKYSFILGALFLGSFSEGEALAKSAGVNFCELSKSSDARDIYDQQIARIFAVNQQKRSRLEKIGFACENQHSSLRVDKSKDGFSCRLKCGCGQFAKSKEILIGINANVAGGDPEFNFSKLSKKDSVFILSGFSRCE